MNFFLSLLNAMPGAITQGMLWGIMAIGVYITYRILDVAGSIPGAVFLPFWLVSLPSWRCILSTCGL